MIKLLKLANYQTRRSHMKTYEVPKLTKALNKKWMNAQWCKVNRDIWHLSMILSMVERGWVHFGQTISNENYLLYIIWEVKLRFCWIFWWIWWIFDETWSFLFFFEVYVSRFVKVILIYIEAKLRKIKAISLIQ